MAESIVHTREIDLWSDAFGDASNPAVLLIMGAESQCIAWPPLLIQQLVSADRYVIRFDNRDVGPSSVIDFDANPYTLDDMADDAIAVLDHYNIDRAHVAGASMGGMITQILMIRHPERMLSATIIMSSPLSGNPDENGRPQMFDDTLPEGPFMTQAADLMPPKAPPDKEDYVAQRAEMFAALSDPGNVDMELLKQFFGLEYDRATDINSKANHNLAIARTEPADRRPLLSGCNIPTTVIHGENDPILPLPHGQAIADAVPGAKMRTFAHMAHDLPEHCWGAIVEGVSHA